MKALSKRIRSNFRATCIVDEIERPECTLSLCGTPRPYLFIDLDLPGSPLGPSDRRCDYLTFIDNVGGMPCVAPVEFKSTLRGKIVEQLQAGANEAERHVPNEFKCQFRPISVIKRFPKGRRKNIRRPVSFVSFRGGSEPIRIVACGDKFVDAL